MSYLNQLDYKAEKIKIVKNFPTSNAIYSVFRAGAVGIELPLFECNTMAELLTWVVLNRCLNRFGRFTES